MFPNRNANARSTAEEPLEVSLASSEMALRHKKSREEFSSTIWRPGDTDIVTQVSSHVLELSGSRAFDRVVWDLYVGEGSPFKSEWTARYSSRTFLTDY
jgi:hypothetical protein